MSAPLPVLAPAGHPDRQVWCRHYDDCLDVAVRLQWPGFSCRECPVWGMCDLAADEIRALAVREASAAQMAIDEAEAAGSRTPW